jgi:hypothetical protein
VAFSAQPTQDRNCRSAFNPADYHTYVQTQRIRKQMEMIRHEYVADQLERFLFTRRCQSIDEERAGMVASKNRHAIKGYGCGVMNEVRLSRFEQMHFAWALFQG